MSNLIGLQNTMWAWACQQLKFGTKASYQIVNMAVIDAMDEIDYITVINSIAFTYNSGVGATIEDIVIGLVAAINLGSEPVVAQILSTNEYSITADNVAIDFALAFDDKQIIDGGKVIWEYANSPRPARPYISLMINTIARFGDIDFTNIDDDGNRKVLGNAYWTLTINAFGSNDASKIDAIDYLETLKLSLKKNSVVNFLYKNYISIVNSLNIVNVTQLRASGYEQHASMDVMLYIVTSSDDNAGVIENVEVTGDILNDDGSVAKQVIINV